MEKYGRWLRTWSLRPGATAGVALHRAGSFLPAEAQLQIHSGSFDTDWTDASQQRAAYYANLSPGHYRFRVAARNRDGVWSETASRPGTACSAITIRRFGFTFWRAALF